MSKRYGQLRSDSNYLSLAYDFVEKINLPNQKWMETEDPEEKEKAKQVYFEALTHTCSYLDELFQEDKGPWWDSTNFEVLLAYELGEEVFIIPINDFTLKKVLKNEDPYLRDALNVSFLPSNFAAYVLYDTCFGLGDVHMRARLNIFNLLSIANEGEGDIISPFGIWLKNEINSKGSNVIYKH